MRNVLDEAHVVEMFACAHPDPDDPRKPEPTCVRVLEHLVRGGSLTPDALAVVASLVKPYSLLDIWVCLLVLCMRPNLRIIATIARNGRKNSLAKCIGVTILFISRPIERIKRARSSRANISQNRQGERKIVTLVSREDTT